METAVGEVVLALVSPAAVAATVVFLGRFVVERWDKRSLEALKAGHSRELEKFRAELQAAHAREIEAFKHDLAASSHERNQRVSVLLEKRASVAGEIYARLVAMKSTIEEIADDMPSEAVGRLVSTFEASKRDFLQLFEPNRPFLPREACALIDDFTETASSSAMEAELLRLLEETTTRHMAESDAGKDDLEQILEAEPEPPPSAWDDVQHDDQDDSPPDTDDPPWFENPYGRKLKSALSAIEAEIRRMLEAPPIAQPRATESPHPSSPA